jgi:hypothetical protein
MTERFRLAVYMQQVFAARLAHLAVLTPAPRPAYLVQLPTAQLLIYPRKKRVLFLRSGGKSRDNGII